MPIHVEFYGIVRAKAGTASAVSNGTTLGEVLTDLARQFPELGRLCIEGDHFRTGFTANLDGQRFITSPETPLAQGDSVLILSLDAGG